MAIKQIEIRHELYFCWTVLSRPGDVRRQRGAVGMEGGSAKHPDGQKRHKHFFWSREQCEAQNAFQKADFSA